MQIEYLNNKIWKNGVICVNMLRLTKEFFFYFCVLIQSRGLLQDIVHMSVEQQVAMFLHTTEHNVRNRLVETNFSRSSKTVSCYFNSLGHHHWRHWFKSPETTDGIPTLRYCWYVALCF
jgi:hypothetical protein